MKSTGNICQSAFSATILLAFVPVLGLALLRSTAPAAVTPGTTPKEFPANPARHQVVIKREAADAKQSALIAAAEAVLPSQEILRQAAGDAAVPTGDKVWWYKEELGIRIPCAITAEAVAYYSDLVEKYGKQVFKRYNQPSSRLDYHAAVKFHKEFKFDDITYNDVHVVTLNLAFSQNFAATEAAGLHFKKERTVILDAQGKVRHVTGDGPTEVPILMM